MPESLPKIAITMGDPAGIGVETILKASLHSEFFSQCHAVVFGDLAWIRKIAQRFEIPIEIKEEIKEKKEDFESQEGNRLFVRQSTTADLSNVVLGELSAEAGKAAVECVISATKVAMSGEFAAIVTAPLNKEAIVMAGYSYPGHTELLAEVTQTPNYGMLLVTENLRVVHVSTHVSLKTAIERVKTARILECIRLGDFACRQLGIAKPRIAVAGLNPHAGENGLFGAEESEEISPAILQAQSENICVEGPFPPDTIFAQSLKGKYDLVVAMYHDQGHIPVKLHGFDSGVNITIGLPIVRVSVDHGTAFDIADKFIASELSMLEAIKIACHLSFAKNKKEG